jgi:hypothetical protein
MKGFLTFVLAVLGLFVASAAGARAGDALEPHIVKTEKIIPDSAEPETVEPVKPESARTEDPKASADFAKRMFADEVTKAKKSYACFVRQYDSAHLGRHPAQKVSAMKLLVTGEIVPEDQALNYSFRLGVKFRDKSHEFSSVGECGHARASEDNNGKEQLGCGVECDGGGVSVELHEDNKSTLVKLETIRIWRSPRSTDPHGRLEGGKDDREFRLDRAPIEQCLSLANDRKERAAMRRM